MRLQTFLPYPDFEESARCLDPSRLGKQRAETLQIFKAITDPEYSWRHHTASRMWRGYEGALLIYGATVAMTWILKFGYKDNTLDKFESLLKSGKYPRDMPHWFGDQEFHDSHKSNLLAKNPRYYSQFGWDVPCNLPYKWPSGRPIT